MTSLARQPRRHRDTDAVLELFRDLKRAHDRLIAALDGLAEVTADPIPHRARFTEARFRLSNASLIRRGMLREAVDYLCERAGPDEARALRQLQSAGPELLLESTAHVRKWTTDAVEANWPDYSLASAAMRLRMAARIDSERAVVYPLLRQRLLD